ncbi:MAG: sterol desaturase family protein [Planctomycetes bacterium]|nr:sterol desaturase family protein [Planctomycetota bacterium]
MNAAACFLGGWAAGVLLEYLLHWIMHRRSLGFHLHHHREFFHLPPKRVALNTLDPRLDLVFFAGVLAALAPLMFVWTWWLVVLFWAGMLWHVVLVYEACHALMHHDAWLPAFWRESRGYRWWKGCHFEHHFHAPAGNYSVTCPWLDWIFGTYVRPRAAYPPRPHPQRKPAGDADTVPDEPAAANGA